jgi:hypothetical protein
MKSFGVKKIIMFNFFLFVTLESMTYVRSSANPFYISIITFELIVVPCDSCPVIPYANVIGNDVL